MRGILMTVAALSMFAAMAATAQAEAIHGAPFVQGNKCWKFSPGGGIVDSRFGSWVDCPQKAGGLVPAVPSTPQATTRRNRATR
jgi:hypothetical protein